MTDTPLHDSGPSLDSRWSNRVPWYLRFSAVPTIGDFDTWFRLVGQRLERLFLFNEANLLNPFHFGASLESETLGRFKFDYGATLNVQLKTYFDAAVVRHEVERDTTNDPEELQAQDLARRQRLQKVQGTSPRRPAVESGAVFLAESKASQSRPRRQAVHWNTRVSERIATLETIFGNLVLYAQQDGSLEGLIDDIRRICAATGVPLDIRGQPPLIVPLDERLLQRAVIDPLLSRLQERWPERAGELVRAYHDVIAGRNLDEVFSNAFKSVEEIARSLTGNPKFEFSDGDLQRFFPTMHPTIKATIAKLRAHRGDAAAHGRKAPDPAEIRYLLFQLCNTALLLLDYDAG